MTIKIYKSNNGEPPYKTIGGNVSYIYNDESKILSVYTGNGWSYFQDVRIIVTYQPDEVLVYEKWNNSKDRFGNKAGEYEPF